MNIIMFKQFKIEQRIPAIDFMKLFASVLVVLSHCMLKYITNGDNNPLFNLIWLTQMPVFMFASGMVVPNPKRIDTFAKYLLRVAKNTLTLLVPCLTFLFFSSLINQKSVIDGFVGFFKNPENNLWFLWVLYLIHLFFDFGIWLSNKTNIFLRGLIPDLIAMLIFAGLVLLMLLFKSFDYKTLGIKLLAYYIPFFVFGHLISIILKKINITPKRKIIAFIVFISALAVLLFESFYFESIFQFDDSNIRYLLIRVVGSLSSTIVLLFLSDFITSISTFSKISKYGMFSLQSYYLHLLFIKIINYSASTANYQWLIAFGTFLLLLAIVVGTLIFIYNVPYLHLLIFGKSFSRYSFEKKLPKLLR